MDIKDTKLVIKDGELQYLDKEIIMHELYEIVDELRLQVNEVSDLLFELVDTKRGVRYNYRNL